MRTRRIEITVTYDPSIPDANTAAESFTEWLRDECAICNDEELKPEEMREGVQDFTFQVTDIEP